MWIEDVCVLWKRTMRQLFVSVDNFIFPHVATVGIELATETKLVSNS